MSALQPLLLMLTSLLLDLAGMDNEGIETDVAAEDPYGQTHAVHNFLAIAQNRS